MGYELAIHGAVLVTPRGRRRASVYVAGGRIAEISSSHHPATREVDADGLHLFSGAVDGHVHFMDPAETDREDFVTGSSAAAVGGVTSVVEHTHARPVRSVGDLREKAEYLRGRSLVDFGLAAHVWPDRIDAISELWRAGVAYFKVFTCTTHGVPGLNHAQILEAFREIAEVRGLALVHCEDEAITAESEAKLRALDAHAANLLGVWRSREAELVAVNTVSLLARMTGVRVIIAHASHPEAVDIAAAHRSVGADLWIEGCPQYLYLHEDDVLEHGAFRKFTPPARVRSRWESEEMWRRVAFGPVTHISSDHAPSTRAHKEKGFWNAPFGLPGVETTLPLLLQGAVNGYLSLERIVELTSEIPARLYGLYPRKGTLRVGADADLVLVDLEASRHIADELVVSKSGWSPFTGMQLRGVPVMSFVRGRLVAEDGRPIIEPGWGEFLPRVERGVA